MAEGVVEERWRDVRRAHLLDAAGRVFARVGYDDASVEEIAHEAGIGKPTLYRYFPGKEALFEAVFAEALDGLEARLDAVLAVHPSFAERLAGMMAEIVPTFRNHLGSMRSLDEGADSKRRLFRLRRGGIERRLSDAIRAGQAEGAVRDIDPELAARFVIGMVRSGVTLRERDEATVASTVAEFARRALEAHS